MRYHLIPTAAAAAKSLQSCPTLCDPINTRITIIKKMTNADRYIEELNPSYTAG